jgi:hypothetical protein
VILIATRPNWLAASTIAYLEGLEENLEQDNPNALVIIQKHLQAAASNDASKACSSHVYDTTSGYVAESSVPTIEDFCEDVIEVLQLRDLEAMQSASHHVASDSDPAIGAPIPSPRDSVADRTSSGWPKATSPRTTAVLEADSDDIHLTETALGQLTLSMYAHSTPPLVCTGHTESD